MPDYEVAQRVTATMDGTTRKLERPLGLFTAANEKQAAEKAAESINEDGRYVVRTVSASVNKRVQMTQKAVAADDPDPNGATTPTAA